MHLIHILVEYKVTRPTGLNIAFVFWIESIFHKYDIVTNIMKTTNNVISDAAEMNRKQ